MSSAEIAADQKPVVIPTPRLRSKRTPKPARSNFEMYSWLFMRLSGILLVFLVVTHITIMLVLDGGISRIGFAFVAGRWANPFWQVWDLLQLWLAELHGVNGLRTIINDYAERDTTRIVLKALLYTSALLVLFLGTLVIFTFDPNIS
ncbi:succinate dehydrogenase [Carbonactinospora thermoautotrophica]|uniref:Succinate dehydrogenase n=1 Tax=Carbonactinospora thermoautotrophica TaxID=1469144 RepID=A0A132N0J7_9ACTN|nr:succinate dehydrogenase hydrophobic membrane anchor subunit [Carbonactinospora thermoautotrophica]KWX02494.1 putative succinate dehydrogenase membrane subunit [Carbonactinospora thermoautotrophica]KWX03603.1 succinate dehydrogenase [Carbonactinospora thermoautotrophica]KWX07555.1 succinate dehydrogenase [Carbonactinospora thermoautotrophica]MCX9190359.1 succinate dehydrogenase [Carbonactinospora thermoautotrophica]